MILTEAQIADLKTNLTTATELGQCEEAFWTKRHAQDCIDTMLALWLPVRAARKWVKASAGFPASKAEAELVKALEDCP